MQDPKPFKLTVEERDSYVYARVKGDKPAPSGSRAYLELIAEHCQRCMCTSILIEKCTPEPFAVWDAFAVAPTLAKIGAPHIKIAVVEKGDEFPAQTALEVKVGRRCGIDVHVFSDGFEAKRWLRSGQTSN